ncbi:MAG TPA: FKBP-type peptidyl-prolyl cis-trans isomerase [Pirellulaceae bacterium]|nr:FKBP-type peptidyl-prolyl cis-trans isomerase [Pirellulaceae bacterium]
MATGVQSLAQESRSDLLPPKSSTEVTGKSLVEKSSYLLGYNFINDFKFQRIDIDLDRLIAGMRDAMENKEPAMSKDLIEAVEEAFQKLVMEKQEAIFKEVAEKNLRDGDEFFAAISKQPGVKKLESGLQYKILKQGNGPEPKTGDVIRFRFKGAFTDGTEFESSGDTPIQYRMGTSIMPGMGEAFSRMRVGDHWVIYIPAKLAFGTQGSPPRIGPNQSLVYELEIVEIAK